MPFHHSPSGLTRAFRRFVLASLASLFLGSVTLQAAPRMISYQYPNCVSCHISPQGRGLLRPYGRGIDMDQSLSDADVTGALLGKILGGDYGDGNWGGNFGPVTADVISTTRYNHEFDTNKTDPAFAAVARMTVQFRARPELRVSTEVGYRDTPSRDVPLGPNLTSVGGDDFYLKKLAVEWRISSGSELVIGRDYLPLGLQIDDQTTYLLNLNRNGIYDYPLQMKYFQWTKKWLASAYVYAPTFDERLAASREWGGGFMYEYYLADNLAVGVQSIVGSSDQAERGRVGAYTRWGISRKWTLLASADYTRFWDVENATKTDGNQLTAFVQLFYHHTPWLVSGATLNYAHSDFFAVGDDIFSARYTLSARINRNLTIGVSATAGDTRRNLRSGQEGTVFASVKF